MPSIGRLPPTDDETPPTDKTGGRQTNLDEVADLLTGVDSVLEGEHAPVEIEAIRRVHHPVFLFWSYGLYIQAVRHVDSETCG